MHFDTKHTDSGRKMVFRNAGFSMNLQNNKLVRLHLPRHVTNDMKTLCCFEMRILNYLDRHELTPHATCFAVKSTKLQDVWHSTTPLHLNSGLRYHESPMLVLRIYPVPLRRTTRDRYGYPRSARGLHSRAASSRPTEKNSGPHKNSWLDNL